MPNKNIELIRQALAASESSIKLAKQLLSELESGKTSGQSQTPAQVDNLPGVVGVFNGESMTTETGENYPVPANYASKSLLVVGDTLKLVEEGKNKEKRFKQIEHVKRHKTGGVLTKKDGKWKVVTPEGSYRVLPAAVEHFKADIGSQVTLQIPAGNMTVPWGALESVSVGQAKPEPLSVSETTENPESKVDPAALPAEKEVKPQPKVEKKVGPKPAEPKKEEPKPKESKLVPAKTTADPKKVVLEPAKVIETSPPVTTPPTPAVASAPAEPKPPVVSPATTTEISPEEDELI